MKTLSLRTFKDEDIVTVQAIYKCPLCDTFITFGNTVQCKYFDLPGLLGKVEQNQLFAGNPYLHTAPLHIPHKCKTGDAGFAYFAGFRQVR